MWALIGFEGKTRFKVDKAYTLNFSKNLQGSIGSRTFYMFTMFHINFNFNHLLLKSKKHLH